jgi:hypothetical protein
MESWIRLKPETMPIIKREAQEWPMWWSLEDIDLPHQTFFKQFTLFI